MICHTECGRPRPSTGWARTIPHRRTLRFSSSSRLQRRVLREAFLASLLPHKDTTLTPATGPPPRHHSVNYTDAPPFLKAQPEKRPRQTPTNSLSVATIAESHAAKAGTALSRLRQSVAFWQSERAATLHWQGTRRDGFVPATEVTWERSGPQPHTRVTSRVHAATLTCHAWLHFPRCGSATGVSPGVYVPWGVREPSLFHRREKWNSHGLGPRVVKPACCVVVYTDECIS